MKELLLNDIRRASEHQRRYADLYEKEPTMRNLATLQAYGTIIENLEKRLKEIEK